VGTLCTRFRIIVTQKIESRYKKILSKSENNKEKIPGDSIPCNGIKSGDNLIFFIYFIYLIPMSKTQMEKLDYNRQINLKIRELSKYTKWTFHFSWGIVPNGPR